VPRAGVRSVAEVVTFAVLALVPFFVGSFELDRLGSFLLYAIFAISVDLLWGYSGILTFGHAVFFGWSAYLFAYLTQHEGGPHLPAGAALVIAPSLMGVLGYALGWFSFGHRTSMRGIYFSVVSFGLAVTSTALALSAGSFTGGQSGILLDYQLSFMGTALDYGLPFYVLSLCLLVVAYVATRLFLSSSKGLLLRGIRDNESRLALYGHDVVRFKRWALAASAALAGIAGVIFHIHAGIVSTESVGIDLSVLACVWVLLGGQGTLIGGVIAAIALNYLNSSLAGTFASTWLLIVGALLVLVVTFARGGLLGAARSLLQKSGAT
jgi:branched-chain amino acid transport system permease protein